jgi:hypothetical protein
MKSLFTVFSVGIAALGFAVLATARLYTDPQCFFVFYQDRSELDAPPVDWNADMLWFFVSETPFLLWFDAYCIGFFLFAWVWKSYRQGGFQASLHQAGWLLLPMVLLVIPASFWSDIPGSGWWIHANYHDGRGDYPLLHVFKPRYIGLLTLAWLAYWGWRFSRDLADNLSAKGCLR